MSVRPRLHQGGIGISGTTLLCLQGKQRSAAVVPREGRVPGAAHLFWNRETGFPAPWESYLT